MSELADQSKVVTADFVRRLNLLIANTVHEGATITSVAGALIGAGIELLMRSGATNDEVQRVCTEMSENPLMSTRKHQAAAAETTPTDCWRTPRGKLLSKQDQILIRLSGEDLNTLHRAIDATMSHLNEARHSEGRVPFAERLVRLREQVCDDKFTVKREDLHALHQALHVAVGHVDDSLVRGSDNRTAFIKRLAQIRKTVIDAVCDHDDVPKQERHYG